MVGFKGVFVAYRRSPYAGMDMLSTQLCAIWSPDGKISLSPTAGPHSPEWIRIRNPLSMAFDGFLTEQNFTNLKYSKKQRFVKDKWKKESFWTIREPSV